MLLTASDCMLGHVSLGPEDETGEPPLRQNPQEDTQPN